MTNKHTMSIEELVNHAKSGDASLLEALKTAKSPADFVAAARALGYDVSTEAPARRGRRIEVLSASDLSRVAGGMRPVRTTASWTFGVSCCWC
jgi:predicted ribosomally synthesized peptide with nif11-like leader